MKPGGVLVLISPYSWIKEWTPEERWLGGEEGGVCKLDPLSCEKQPVSTNFDFVEQRKDVTSVLFQLETPVRCFPELAAPLTKGYRHIEYRIITGGIYHKQLTYNYGHITTCGNIR